ncbi:MAG TPA: helix-turn-helix domain-containing protein [Steroidobacteraceae bacterium]|nr:helix-turn-helix domain-containing protein [Steroidobacteraceae bacterium]
MRIRRETIPVFALYGDRPPGRLPVPLHIESIQARSRRYSGEIAPHRHTSLCQCLYVRRGPVAVHLEDIRRDLRGPLMVIVPAGAVHGFRMREDTSGYVLTVALDELLLSMSGATPGRVEEFLQSPRIIELQGDEEAAVRLERHFCLLHDEFRHPDGASSALPVMLAAALVSLIASRPAEKPSMRGGRSNYALLRRFHALVDTNLAAHWPVPRYASSLGLTESALNRLCRRQLGNSALEVVQQRLALEARRRLIYVSAPVARIGADLGFRDPAYFCRFFRRHTGKSPRDYRKQLQ